MTLFQIGMFSACLIYLGETVWSKKRHFLDTGEFNGDMKLLVAINLIGYVSTLYAAFAGPIAGWPVAGMLLYGASFVLFAWAVAATRGQRLSLAFAGELPATVVTSGPYAWTRHPFYLSYLLFWLAGPVATGEPWLAIFPVLLAVHYRRAAQMEERRFAQSGLALEYASYAERVPALTRRIG